MKQTHLVVALVVIAGLAVVYWMFRPLTPREIADRVVTEMDRFSALMEGVRTDEEFRAVEHEASTQVERVLRAFKAYTALPLEQQKALPPEVHDRIHEAEKRFEKAEEHYKLYAGTRRPGRDRPAPK